MTPTGQMQRFQFNAFMFSGPPFTGLELSIWFKILQVRLILSVNFFKKYINNYQEFDLVEKVVINTKAVG